MCGIAGLLRLGENPVFKDESKPMCDAMVHRGPKNAGYYAASEVVLGMRRLSIIDLETGHQPVHNEDQSVWVVFNGEIYNFKHLRADLELQGHRFYTDTDTEVIVHLYEQYGEACVEKMRGMFAFAVWDANRKKLLLARDRLGIKPLFYSVTGGRLAFGSELKVLLQLPEISRQLSWAAVSHLFSAMCTPATQSIVEGVQKVKPGHLLIASAEGGIRVREYWDVVFDPDYGKSEQYFIERLRDLLEQSVRLRLIADVPLGAFLSGGVDSSAVVATMARIGSGRVKTFSIGFSAKEYDETRYARMVAEHYATDHEEFVVEPDAVAVLPKLVRHYGEPFADPSAIPTYYVSEMARRRVTVALNGDGGDEAFLGYPRYQAMRYLAQLDRLPNTARLALAHVLGAAPGGLQRKLRLAQIRDVLLADRERPAQRYGATLAFFAERDKTEGYGEAMHGALAHSVLDRLRPYFAGGDLVEGANRADIHTYLPDDLMVKVDVASMAHGLETRSPLLDHVLLEWAARIPAEVKMAGGRAKALFKAAMAPYLPGAILRRKKMGFGCPIDQWLRRELKDLAYDTLLSPSARERGLMRPDYVKRLLDDHCAYRANHHTRLWALLMLELWFRT